MPAIFPSVIDRWKSGSIPRLWDDARNYFVERLGNLERILNFLHGAIEHPRPSVDDTVAAAGNTAITTLAAVDVGVSTTFVPIVDMTVLVNAGWDVQITLFGGLTQYFVGTLVVNGTPQTRAVVWGASAVGNRVRVSQTWTLTLKSGTSTTLKLQGATTNVLTQFQVNSIHSSMVVQRFPNTYKPS